MKKFRRKTASEVSSQIISIERMQRFNPLRDFSPDKLRIAHEEFNAGRLRPAAKLWDAIERTDDVIKVVAGKRKKAVSRHGYEIVPVDESPEAKRHAEVLRFFYDNLVASRADDKNVRGGFPMAVRHMMDAVGKRYSVHEIVWKPIEGGLTAELVFVPLWYFENTTGELRILTGLSDLNGEGLEPGGWIVASGDGLMEACAAAYMFKHLPLQDWLYYSEKFGMPTPVGKSPDQPGTPGWVAMEDAVAALGACEGVVVSGTGSIEYPTAGSAANMPYPALVERMDRALAALWRGADLGTLSADNQGASLQGDETDLLEDDDAENISDTLNEQLDRFVVLYALGETTPKAWMRIRCGVREDVDADLKVDEALDRMGVRSPLDELERRYGRTGLVPRPATPSMTAALANERVADPAEVLKRNARRAIAEAVAADMQPVVDRLAEILDTVGDDKLPEALERFQAEELPGLAAAVLADPASADAIADTLSANLLNGMDDAGRGAR